MHHISCGFAIIHLTLADSQGEVCDEAEAIYYTFGSGKAQEMRVSGCKVEGEYKVNFEKCSFEMSGFASNYSFRMSKNSRNHSFKKKKKEDSLGIYHKKSYLCRRLNI